MKTESTVMYVLRITLTMLIIAAVVAALLAGVNSVTKPIIDRLTIEKTQKAINTVLEGGGEKLESFQDDTGLVSRVYQGENGYAVEVKPVGFDSAITMMVGVSNEGTVTGISIVSHKETKGLGEVAAANSSAGEAFRNQFIGMSGSVAVTKDGGEIDALTGATVTSRAICEGVNAALACVANMG